MRERRNEVRLLCADVLEVWWQPALGRPCRATGLLEDVSPSGACLQLDTEVPCGVEIHWRGRRREFSGRVRYCVYREIGYFVGIQLTPGCKWSKRLYKPRHLLDWSELGWKLPNA